MRQTKLESLVESSANTASGFIVSLVFWRFVVVPLFDLPVSESENIAITAMFTVLSVARSYVWRRFFNAGLHRVVHALLRGNHAGH